MAVRAKPAASLILLWSDPDRGAVRVFMGLRSASARFLPGVLVFPGGRLERKDFHRPDRDVLAASSARAMLFEAGRGRSREHAHAFAQAALRECAEETGLVARDHLAGPLTYVARAITPAYVPTRYDTRFLLGWVNAGCDPPMPASDGDGELVSPDWHDISNLAAQPLHHVTQAVVMHVKTWTHRPSESENDRLLIAERTPNRWRGASALRSADLKAQVQ